MSYSEKNILFIVNPLSGKGLIKPKLLEVIDVFVSRGFNVNVHTTQAVKDAENYIIRHANECSLVVASGGDGTLSECVNALMKLQGPRPKIGYIPSGSTNDFAASLNLSKDCVQAAKDIINGKILKCDVGQFNFNYFTYIAAFGAFTDVSYETPQDIKNFWGHAAYIIEGIKRLSTIKPIDMKVICDDKIIEGQFIYGMITNTTSIGGVMNLSKTDVNLSDGLFELILIKPPQTAIDYQNLIAGILGQDFSNKDLFYYTKTEKAEFISKELVKYTIDGENGGAHVDVLVQNHKKAINFLTPKNKP